MFAMQLKDKDLLDYLYYYLSYFKYRYIHKYLETGTQSNINADIVRGIMIPTYGHSRNMEIASTLQGFDAKIDNELSVLELFNRQKQLSFVPDVYMNIWARKYCFCMVSKISLRSSLMTHSSYKCSIFATKRMLLTFEEYGNTKLSTSPLPIFIWAASLTTSYHIILRIFEKIKFDIGTA